VQDEISLRKCSGGIAHLRTFRGRISCKKCVLLAAMLLSHSCFFTHSINQGWTNLFNRRAICRKPKTPASRKTSLQCQYKYGKECKFFVKWCTVIVSIKFLFDFLVPENLDSMLLKLCKLILASVQFSGLHDGLVLRTSFQRKKSQQYVVLYTEMSYIPVFLNSGYLLSGTCRQKLSVEWHWLKFLQRKWTYAKKKISSVTETVAYSVFLVRNVCSEKMFVSVSMDV